MNGEFYFKEDACLDAIAKFFEDCKVAKADIHSIKIIRNGEVYLKAVPSPYTTEIKAQLYSLSKSFTSTAIGMLVDDGIISVEDRVVDIFKDKCPETISENLSKMKIKHLLSMNTGHEECQLPNIINSSDLVKEFLARDVPRCPGTHFAYNSAASFMLSAIVTEYTNMSMFDFLNKRLFKPLGIKNALWDDYNGISQGGIGLHLNVDDIAKFGIMYLNKGVYNGERLLSEEWIDEATRSHSDNHDNGPLDWSSGYGYQIWINEKEGFRGDGAFGQLCVVLPETNAVIAITAQTDIMQPELTAAIELAKNIIGKSTISEKELTEKINSLYAPEKTKEIEKIPNCIYKCSENGLGITQLSFEKEDKNLILNISNGKQQQRMVFGCGEYVYNNIKLRHFSPTIVSFSIKHGEVKSEFSAYYVYDEKLKLVLRHLDNPHLVEIECEFKESELNLKFNGLERVMYPDALEVNAFKD